MKKQLQSIKLFWEQLSSMPRLFKEAQIKGIPWSFSRTINKEIKQHYNTNPTLKTFKSPSERPFVHLPLPHAASRRRQSWLVI